MRGVTTTFSNSVKIIFASTGASEQAIDTPSHWKWWRSLTMVPAVNKVKCLSSVNDTTKTVHHQQLSGGNYPGGGEAIVQGPIILERNCLGGNCPGGNYLGRTVVLPFFPMLWTMTPKPQKFESSISITLTWYPLLRYYFWMSINLEEHICGSF